MKTRTNLQQDRRSSSKDSGKGYKMVQLTIELPMAPLEENQYVSCNVGQLKLTESSAIMVAEIRNGLQKTGQLTTWKSHTQAHPIRYVLDQVEAALMKLQPS